MSNPSIDPNASLPPPNTNDQDLPSMQPTDSVPEEDGGPVDTIQTSSSAAFTTAFLINFPQLDVNLNTYQYILGSARNEFTKTDRESDVSSLRLTKEFWREIEERCKLTRSQRDRLQNYFHSWANMANKINAEASDMNTNVNAYNSAQLPNDNAQINAFNIAIQQYNIDQNLANFQIAVDAYNAYFLGANQGGIATYDNSAIAFNAEVTENNQKILQLNQFAANFTPPLPQMPLETLATLAGQVPAFPPPPYTVPLLQIPQRPMVLLLPPYPSPPDPGPYTDPTLAGDQISALETLIFSRQLLDSKDTYRRIIQFIQRGKIPQTVDTYIPRSPKPQSGGAASSMTGIGSMLFGDSSVKMEGQLSLSTMLAALSEYDRVPQQSPGVQFSKETSKQELANALTGLIAQITLFAALSAGAKFEANFKSVSLDENLKGLLIASELAGLVISLKESANSRQLQTLAAELVKGILGQQGATSEEILAATKDIQVLLENLLAQNALQAVAFSLNAPGLIGQLLAHAAPQFAAALKPPSEVEFLNTYFLSSSSELDRFKSALAEKVASSTKLPKKEVVLVVEQAVDVAAKQVPFTSVGEFFQTLESLIATGNLPQAAPSEVSSGPIPTAQEAPVQPQPPPLITPLPIDRTQLQEALNQVVPFVINELPLPFAPGRELDRPFVKGEINANTFANSAAAQRAIEGTGITLPALKTILNTTLNAQPATIRDFRDDFLKASLKQYADLKSDQQNAYVQSVNLQSSNLASANVESGLQSEAVKDAYLQSAYLQSTELSARNLLNLRNDAELRSSYLHYTNLNDSIIVGNRVTQEIIDARISQESFNVNQLDLTVVQESIKEAYLQSDIQYQEDAAADLTKTEIRDAYAASAARDITQVLVNQNAVRLRNENEVRDLIREQLTTQYNLDVDRANQIAVNARFTVDRTPLQALNAFGVEKPLPLPVLAEALNSLIAKQFGNVLPPYSLSSFASELITRLLGAHNLINDIELGELQNPNSIVSIIRDATLHYADLRKQKVAWVMAEAFRRRMAPMIDAYVFSLELMDPGKLYLRSKFEGISYTRNEPSFRSSIDIII